MRRDPLYLTLRFVVLHAATVATHRCGSSASDPSSGMVSASATLSKVNVYGQYCSPTIDRTVCILLLQLSTCALRLGPHVNFLRLCFLRPQRMFSTMLKRTSWGAGITSWSLDSTLLLGTTQQKVMRRTKNNCYVSCRPPTTDSTCGETLRRQLQPAVSYDIDGVKFLPHSPPFPFRPLFGNKENQLTLVVTSKHRQTDRFVGKIRQFFDQIFDAYSPAQVCGCIFTRVCSTIQGQELL